jgi:hypothetical protein
MKGQKANIIVSRPRGGFESDAIPPPPRHQSGHTPEIGADTHSKSRLRADIPSISIRLCTIDRKMHEGCRSHGLSEGLRLSRGRRRQQVGNYDAFGIVLACCLAPACLTFPRDCLHEARAAAETAPLGRTGNTIRGRRQEGTLHSLTPHSPALSLAIRKATK